MVYKQQNALWRVRSGDKATKRRELHAEILITSEYVTQN